MATEAFGIPAVDSYPVHLRVTPALSARNRLTTAFRLVLAIPHLALLGAPIAAVLTWCSEPNPGVTSGWGGSGGLLGAVVVMAAVIAWFAILFTDRYPVGLSRRPFVLIATWLAARTGSSLTAGTGGAFPLRRYVQ